jgi:two-component system nitrogen regulation response regulator GlnG
MKLVMRSDFPQRGDHVNASDLLGSTLEPTRIGRTEAGFRVPSLTVLFHLEDPGRIGDVARLMDLLEGRECALSRLEPLFAQPRRTRGQPLGDRHLSRTPAKLIPEGDGVRLVSSGTSLRADGAPLTASQWWSHEQLERGVVIEMAERVVLLLHLLGPPAPRQPELGMVGESEAIERIRAEVLQVAPRQLAVLLLGESGAGKELVARAIAGIGPRASGPFVAVNLAALPASMAASELFGHAAGAFTGASGAHAGLFIQADGGTLFLDEVAAAPLDVQAMLLRVLETREVQPLGSERRRAVDVRVVAATDEDLTEAIGAGRFRDALFHRLSGYEIALPPLRDRRDDFGRLLIHFLRKELRDVGEERRLSELAAKTPWLPVPLVARLASYDWPGNVRQLVNVARRLVLATRGGRVAGEEILPRSMLDWASLRRSEADEPAAAGDPTRPPSEIGAEALQATLRENQWRIGAAARALGISRTSLYALIDASDGVRKAKDIPPDELRTCYEACGGDLDAMAERLHVSRRGIQLRLKELGLS